MKTKVQIHADGDETCKQLITYDDLVWVATDSPAVEVNLQPPIALADIERALNAHCA